MPKTLVVGAGPVGALAALYAAERGDDVEVYELRSDLRDPATTPLNFTKSINLAMSERGINSLKKANRPKMLQAILDETIPMHGRMIHGRKNGQVFEQSQKYDVHGRFLRAADRAGINRHLLDELEMMPNVKLIFNHKLVGADFKKNIAWFEKRSPHGSSPETHKTSEVEVKFDFMIGADGAHSAVRYHQMKYARVSYQQDYIDTLWCEFHIPATVEGSANGHNGFMLSPHHLHIWPAGSFMFIAIPSMDRSFVCTLFMSASHFDSIDSNIDDLVPFFDKNFPGVVGELIEPDALRRQYSTNPHLALISIKSSPYHYDSSVVVIGDAAHAMVPFYGQGMNAGLEDVRVLFDILDEKYSRSGQSPEDMTAARRRALEQYSAQRAPDAHAINDLAMGNYVEMRSSVRSPIYLLRKTVEEYLNNYLPSLDFATQYARVSFSNQPYTEVDKAIRRQTVVLNSTAAGFLVAGLATIGAFAWRWQRT